ncbi:hypothetical protein IE53DRAFT_73942 [Violaceomyces palustris]|uniref:Uncharacterized protein n=1 Tax=Violaceomyces palustris TaxID=1673888 RepID=A0ACD0NYJ7_9BASI|nr:hypothetical protein IE53DRAFT_73942 [Violaceomyces palustris]
MPEPLLKHSNSSRSSLFKLKSIPSLLSLRQHGQQEEGFHQVPSQQSSQPSGTKPLSTPQLVPGQDHGAAITSSHDANANANRSAFSKLKGFGASKLKRGNSSQTIRDQAPNDSFVKGQSLPTDMNRQGSSAVGQGFQTKPEKRKSRLLDAFKSSKRTPATNLDRSMEQPASFESNQVPEALGFGPATSSPTSQHDPLPLAIEAYLSGNDSTQFEQNPSPERMRRLSSSSSADYHYRHQMETRQERSQYPPSTTKTRRPVSVLSMGRRLSTGLETMPVQSSRGSSPTSGLLSDPSVGSFNLHSFRNVRRGSDASKLESGKESRRTSILTLEGLSHNNYNNINTSSLENPTLASPFTEDAPRLSTTSNFASISRSVPASPGRNTTPPTVGGQVPFQQLNANSSSMSVAKFRQASRTKSEIGSPPSGGAAAEEDPHLFGASPRMLNAELGSEKQVSSMLRSGGGGGGGFPSSNSGISPSQELAALEAELSAGGRATPLMRMSKGEAEAHAGQGTVAAGGGAPTSSPSHINPLVREAAEVTLASPASNTEATKRGALIVVEGLDRAGKSTQVARLAEALEARSIKFPERTTAIGKMIDSYLAQERELDDRAIHLLFSANRWECARSIIEEVESGRNVVCDRYAFSGIAYSCSKGLDYEWCRNPDIGLPLPDLTVFLDLDAEAAAARGGYGEERYEKLEFQARVRQAFHLVAQDVSRHGGQWSTVDAGASLDRVTEEIMEKVRPCLDEIRSRGSKIGRLFVREPETTTTSASHRQAAIQAAKQSVPFAPPLNHRRIVRNMTSPEIPTHPHSQSVLTTVAYLGHEGVNPSRQQDPHHQSRTPAATTTGEDSERLLAFQGGTSRAGTRELYERRSSSDVGRSSGSVVVDDHLDRNPPNFSLQATDLLPFDRPNPIAKGHGMDSARILNKYASGGVDGDGRRPRTLIDAIESLQLARKNQQGSTTLS